MSHITIDNNATVEDSEFNDCLSDSDSDVNQVKYISCCFCLKTIDFESFLSHYLNCTNIYSKEENQSALMTQAIRHADDLLSEIYTSIALGNDCKNNLQEYNKEAKVIHGELKARELKESPINPKETNDKEKKELHEKLEALELGFTTNSSNSLNHEGIKPKNIKEVSCLLKQLSCDDIKMFRELFVNVNDGRRNRITHR